MAKGKGKLRGKGGGPRAPAARLTPQQLYEQAQLALQYDDFDSARTALRKAVKLDPKNIECTDALGALLAEVGPEEEAVEVLRQAVALSPEVGYEKYLYLGQLLEGPGEALAATRKGVAVLEVQQAAAQTAASPDAPALSRALSGAMCSLCEMLMAGGQEAAAAAAEAGGDEAAVEAAGRAAVGAVAEEVEHLLARAGTADPHSPEPGQALAALRYQQGRPAEALEALRRSMALWHTPASKEEGEEAEGACGAAAAAAAGTAAGGSKGGDDEAMADADESGEEEDSEEGSEEEEDDGPSYEFRIECTKLLLELEDTTASAIDVLEGLIEEDDRVPDAWHLLALAYYSGHQYMEAAEVLTKGQALLAKLGAGPEDEMSQEFADLECAIKEAIGLQQQQQQQGN